MRVQQVEKCVERMIVQVENAAALEERMAVTTARCAAMEYTKEKDAYEKAAVEYTTQRNAALAPRDAGCSADDANTITKVPLRRSRRKRSRVLKFWLGEHREHIAIADELIDVVSDLSGDEVSEALKNEASGGPPGEPSEDEDGTEAVGMCSICQYHCLAHETDWGRVPCCGSCFHRHCILSWLRHVDGEVTKHCSDKMAKTCPICKKPLSSSTKRVLNE